MFYPLLFLYYIYIYIKTIRKMNSNNFSPYLDNLLQLCLSNGKWRSKLWLWWNLLLFVDKNNFNSNQHLSLLVFGFKNANCLTSYSLIAFTTFLAFLHLWISPACFVYAYLFWRYDNKHLRLKLIKSSYDSLLSHFQCSFIFCWLKIMSVLCSFTNGVMHRNAHVH